MRVYDKTGNVTETHEHAGDFKEFRSYSNRETVRVRLYYLEGMGSLSVEEILAAGGPPQKQKKKKGKTGEKVFLSRVRGKWTGFRSRAAFGRSDRNWNSGNLA